MKIKYVGIKGDVDKSIKRIYRLVLKHGYSIKRITKLFDPWYRDVVVLRLKKDDNEEEIILYPPGRVVTSNRHGEKV